MSLILAMNSNDIHPSSNVKSASAGTRGYLRYFFSLSKHLLSLCTATSPKAFDIADQPPPITMKHLSYIADQHHGPSPLSCMSSTLSMNEDLVSLIDLSTKASRSYTVTLLDLNIYHHVHSPSTILALLIRGCHVFFCLSHWHQVLSPSLADFKKGRLVGKGSLV